MGKVTHLSGSVDVDPPPALTEMREPKWGVYLVGRAKGSVRTDWV